MDNNVVRIGNDVRVRWELLTGGESIPLEGRDIQLEMTDPSGRVHGVLDFLVDGTVLRWTYPGTAQRLTGRYMLTAWENRGKAGQAVVDTMAFTLVSRSFLGDIGGSDALVSAGFSSGVPGVPGKSAYEIAVEHGYEGTEEEWLAALMPDLSGIVSRIERLERQIEYLAVWRFGDRLPAEFYEI